MKTETPGALDSGVRKRTADSSWEFVITIPHAPAQRCNACNKRYWLDGRALKACPACGGQLRGTRERRQQWTSGFETKLKAKKARIDALHELGQGTHVVRNTITLGDWLTGYWLPSLEGTSLRETTRQGYASHVDNHLAPTTLGALPIQQVTREQIGAFYGELLRGGRLDGRRDDAGALKPLSKTTLRRVHATLHRALRDAVRSHLLPLNPADDLSLPDDDSGALDAAHHDKPRLMAWDSTQLRRFLATVEDDDLHCLWLTYAMTGARRGELLGLTWDDVDLQAAQLTIRRAHVEVGGEIRESRPKTASGVRTIAIDPETVAALRRHRTAQTEQHVAAGPRWQETGHIFVDALGEPWAPGIVSRAFTAAVQGAREALDSRTRDELLPRLSLHGLRHTHATILLNELRWPVTVVSRRLGHKNETITLTLYSEALPRYDNDAAAAFAGLVLPKARRARC
jgi:integrase